MENQSYYRFPGERDNNRRVDDRSLAVNCAGISVPGRKFVTENPIGREDFYLQYLVAGEMLQATADGERRMLPGDAYLHLPHCRYRYGSNSPDVRYYWVHFSGSDAERILAECGLLERRIFSVGLHKRLSGGFEKLFGEFVARDEFFELSLSQILTKLLIDFARLKSGSDTQSDDDRIGRVIAKLHRYSDREISIAELAAEEYLSEGRLRVLFKERCGISPHRYLTSLRIDNARELLDQPDLTIAEVAAAVGIPDALYFSRVFREFTGVSPSEFRRRSEYGT